VYTVLLIRDSTQVNLNRVRHLIKHLEDQKVTGVKLDSVDVKKAMVAERDAIRALLQCGNQDVRIAPRLIGSLSSLVGADGMKSHT
jgi:hypothetical protein